MNKNIPIFLGFMAGTPPRRAGSQMGARWEPAQRQTRADHIAAIPLLLVPLGRQQRQPLLARRLVKLGVRLHAQSTIPAGSTFLARGLFLSVSPSATRTTLPVDQMWTGSFRKYFQRTQGRRSNVGTLLEQLF